MTSVFYQNASITSAVQPTMTGDWILGGWFQVNAASYGTGVDPSPFAMGTTGGDSEGVLMGVFSATNTTLSVIVFDDGGANISQENILTGSNVDWVFVSVQHASGEADYLLRWGDEISSVFQSQVLNCGAQLTQVGGIFLGSDQFGGFGDSNQRSFFVQEALMSDAQLLAASRSLDVPPAGTNLHFMRQLNAGTATVNGGSAADWTNNAGTLQTAAGQPVFPAIGGNSLFFGAGSVG